MKKSFHYINSPHREGAEVDPMFTPRVARVRKAQYLRNENIIPGTVTGVLVCVNYSDYLVHCIDANHDKLGKIIVVTTPEDVDTHASDHAYDALRYMIMSRPRMENPLERLRGFKRDMFKPADSDFGY